MQNHDFVYWGKRCKNEKFYWILRETKKKNWLKLIKLGGVFVFVEKKSKLLLYFKVPGTCVLYWTYQDAV